MRHYLARSQRNRCNLCGKKRAKGKQFCESCKAVLSRQKNKQFRNSKGRDYWRKYEQTARSQAWRHLYNRTPGRRWRQARRTKLNRLHELFGARAIPPEVLAMALEAWEAKRKLRLDRA